MNDDEKIKVSKEKNSNARLVNEDNFSLGEYQRLKLTKLILNKFVFLLIDEPTCHLDIKQKEELKEERENLLIEHDKLLKQKKN